MSSPREIQAILAALGRAPAALATLIGVTGSSYRQPGARCLVFSDGTSIGSISGGCLEEDVRHRAQRVLATGAPEVAVYDTATENDLIWGTGLGCQGEVRVFFERLPQTLPQWVVTLGENLRHGRDTELHVVHGGPDSQQFGTHLAAGRKVSAQMQTFVELVAAPPALAVFGAGDDAMPLVELARQLGWHVTVFDAREAYATPDRFPGARAVVAAPAPMNAAHPSIDSRTHVVLMSHRYRDDLAALRELLQRPLAYLGVLGPRRRTDRMLDELRAEGVQPGDDLHARFFAPIGLDLGGAAPETVALSIIAELQAFHSRRAPQHLRDGTRPIHG